MVDASNPEILDSYRKALANHDWFYHYTEDHRVWKAGQASWDRIRSMQPNLDNDYSIWNEHCPAEFKLYKK